MNADGEIDTGARLASLEAENARLRQALALGRGAGGNDSDGLSFSAIANSVDQMIWSTRPDGYHDYYNRRWYDYTGMPEGSTDGEEWNGMFHPDDQPRAWDAWRRSLQTGALYEIEYRLRHRSGEYRWVLGRAQPVRGPDGAILRWYGTCTDIHELKRAEERLRANDERLRLVVDSATDHAIFTTDPERTITSWSTGAARIFGYSAEEAIGRCADILWTPEDRANGQPEHETETAGREGCANDERWHQRADGGRVFLNGSVHPLPPDAEGREQGFIKIARDETERRATEDALHEAEGRFRFLDTLSKATQGEHDPEAIMAAATRLLGEHLGVDICAYADVGPDGDAFTIRRDWTAPGVPSIVGSYSLDAFGAAAAVSQRAGVPLVVHDAVGELGAEQAKTFTSIGIAATICLPLVKNGRLAAMMAVHSAAPRTWTDSEVTLVAEVVERCWAHVERVGAEAELRERESRFRDLADNIPALCWWADASGFIYWYNRRWYEYTGTEPADMEGWGWQSVHDPDCLPEVMERWPASIASGQPFEMVFPLRGADGTFRPFLTRAVPLRDHAGAIVRWFGTNTDISEQRRVEDALRDSEARLTKANVEQQAILSQLAEGVIVADAEGRISFVNDAAKQLHGVEALGVAPSDYADTYHLFREDGTPHPFDELPLARAVMNRETVVDARWLIRRSDGTEVLAIGSAQPIRDGEGRQTGAILTLRDDTERFAVETAWREGEERLRLVLDAAPGGFYSVDRDGTTSLISRGLLDMIGFADEDQAIGRKLHDLIHHTHPDGSPYPVAECPIYQCASTGKAAHVTDELFFRLDGSSVPVEYWVSPIFRDGVHVGAVCTILDLTERRKTETALRETEERYRVAADATQDAIWDWDLASNAVRWNEALYAVFGYAREDVEPTGDWWLDHIHPDDRRRISESIHHVIDGTGQRWQEEYRYRTADGGYRSVLDRGFVIRDAAGGAVRMIGAMLDQTERMQAERHLQELNDTLEQRVAAEVEQRSAAEEQLRQMQKMETLGQLTGGVAHDFNNLLQIVTGNLEILQRNLPEDQARLRRSADNAMRGAERAAVLTQRLLAFARRQPLEPKPISLNRLIGGMSELLHRTLGETYEVETVLASGLWNVDADPNQLENAIINLAVNARDAMPGGGKLTIETSNTSLDHAYAAQNTGVTPGQYVVICVSDTGTGMDTATLERVFEPFFTTKDVGRGTGLGLSMVYGFVKQSGGHVKVYSEAGEGTTVKLYLPRRMGPVEDEQVEADPLVPEGSREETILVCEDDDDVRTYSVEVLRELGYRVLEAHDGPSALRLLERQDGEVDLLFTDVVLPSGIMGDKLAEQARALRPGLKVLFTTGYARNAIVHHGRLDPGVELITKPFTYADLAARIRDLLDQG